MTAFLEIKGRRIGPGQPVYVVAELSANHNRDFDRAARLIEAAQSAGADAVKLQTYTADALTIPCDAPQFRISGGTPWDGRTLHDLYAEAAMPWEWQPRLKEIAEGLGLHLFSTAFDPAAVDFLEGMAVPVHKAASFEITDLALIGKMARTGKPLILSTGLATLDEIRDAVSTARDAGARQIALLRCASAYPARPEDMNLRMIPDLGATFGLPVGLSDHTLGREAAVAAVALGACIVEKHLTLSRAVPGVDSAFSMEPHEFRTLVEAIRTVEKSLGNVYYGATEGEEKSRVFRRSLFVVEDVRKGDLFTGTNVRAIRPGQGLAPKHLSEVLGQRAARDVARGTPLAWDLVQREGG